MPAPLIECRRLTKTYKKGDATITPLHELDLDVSAGDFLALMGPSGSGKTTLLNLIAGIDRPTGGTLRIAGVDIATLRGSGPGGEILAEDIMKASASAAPAVSSAAAAAPAAATARPTSPPSAAPSGPPEAVSSIGRIMAERTTQSWTTVPHFFVTREVDATALNATRARWIPIIEKSHGVKVTHTDFIVAAVARALHLHPRMNGSWANDKITLNSHVNVALAMAVENAVVTAVIRDTDRIGLGDIAKQRKELAERARANRLQPADITGATFTISNLGMFNVDAFTAIIVPPQAGILAVGAITDRVVAVDGMIGVRPTVNLTLSSDHRVVDGARAAAFLNDVVLSLVEVEKWAR